jgi:hypothetical protein
MSLSYVRGEIGGSRRGSLASSERGNQQRRSFCAAFPTATLGVCLQ